MLSNFPEEMLQIWPLFPHIIRGILQSANLYKSSFILKCINPHSFSNASLMVNTPGCIQSNQGAIRRMSGRQSVMRLLIMEDMSGDH